MSKDTIDTVGAFLAFVFIIVTFALSIAYELKHGSDDEEDN